ncbi:hypothetical protein HUG17_10112 [Dermatophagoides farinae]|uniref:Uncharacterized protein n=1 Tax=Dermatophagoides farinae TaxID=6954 RepID=A0A9D4P294_DERFA|nr:hypothetical protein HUG17_10112 [Dermatophagoides farinae]
MTNIDHYQQQQRQLSVSSSSSTTAAAMQQQCLTPMYYDDIPEIVPYEDYDNVKMNESNGQYI